VLLLALLSGLPATVAPVYVTWTQPYSFEVRWTVITIVGAVWIGAAAVAFQMVTRALYLQANLLGALREGDYSIRGAGTQPGSAADMVMQEINALGDTLQRQRTEAVESTKLLQSVMGAIDVAVFAFDMDAHLVLVNPAAERLIGRPEGILLGRSAEQLHLADYLTGDTREAQEQKADELVKLLAAQGESRTSTSFDGGARRTPAETRTPEEEHNLLLLRAAGRPTT